MTEDSNNNTDVPDGGVRLRPSPVVRSPKRVQFPTLQEIEKNICIAPPGSTPISSETNITAMSDCKRRVPRTKLLHSSTSLEVEISDDISTVASTCTLTSTDAASVPTFVPSSSQDKQSPESIPYQQPRLPPPRRGSSVPATRSVSTEPEESLMSPNAKTTISMTDDVCRKFSPSLPSKSILRKPLLALKDANSNIRVRRCTGSSGSLFSAAPASRSLNDNVNERTTITNNMWMSMGKTCMPIVSTASSRMSRREYRTPRTKSTISSNGTCCGESIGNSSESKSVSLDVLPPMMTQSRGGKSVRKQLHNLTSVLEELKEKEVVFDRASAIQALKARILRGERVTHEEIKAVRNMTLPPHQRHLGYRLPWSKDLYCDKGLVHIPTPNKPPPPKNTFGTMEDLRIPIADDKITMEHYGRRQYVLNLAGFEDEHISLYLEGRNRLVLRAERHDGLDGEEVPITVTETILLPPDLPADNLRIVRKPSGTTIIEESWRF